MGDGSWELGDGSWELGVRSGGGVKIEDIIEVFNLSRSSLTANIDLGCYRSEVLVSILTSQMISFISHFPSPNSHLPSSNA